MATRIPPPPITTEDKGAWSSWYLAIKEAINQLAALAHNSLPGLQGGTTTQRYHLTATDVTGLTGGGVTSLHQHTIHAVRSLAFGVIAANATAELTATVTGALTGAAVMVGPP